MSTKPDGGPAFPSDYLPKGVYRKLGTGVVTEVDVEKPAGMTLRDYFAGQALIGIMSDEGMRPSNLEEFAHMAARLYQVADAMLAERAK